MLAGEEYMSMRGIRGGMPRKALWLAPAIALAVVISMAARNDGPPIVKLQDGPKTGTLFVKATGVVQGITPVTAENASSPGLAGPVRSSGNIAAMFPAQAQATADPQDPAGNHWALLIGINHYSSPTEDNVGSRPDAEALRSYLRSLGWRDDHILLLTDTNATANRIVQAIRWLASKTDPSSVVVFHYSGHERPIHNDVDNDGESRDVALWATDNKLIVDGTLGRELGKVRASRMWLHFAACRAGGFSDPVTVKSGRVATYSSPESELSYEDKGLRHSVFGYYVIAQGLRRGAGDRNRDGVVTVQEAYSFARPHVTRYTDGRQHPMIIDRSSGAFVLSISRTPPEGGNGEPESSTSPRPRDCGILPCL
jgi:caspase domain-containing protein